MVKILLVTDLYPIEKDSTIPKAIEDFALGIKEFGIEICVIRPNFLLNTLIRKHKILKNGTYFSNNIKIFNKNFILPFLNNDISFLDEKFDIIISHLPSGHIYSFLINKKLNLPHIAIVHQSDRRVLDNFKYKFYFKNKLKKALDSATKIGARNTFLKEKFKADFILPSFVESKNIIEKKVFKNKKLKLVTLSQLIKRKNIDLTIKALSNVDFDFEYNIYGNGPEKNKLQKLIKNLNLEEKIKLNPYLPHEQIYSKLDENDVFILTSVNESFGISYIEAMSRGLVVVGTKNTGIDGIIKNNINGFLINPKTDEITEILNKINKINKEEISDNTIKTIKTLTKEKVIKDYLDVIYSVLN